MPGAPGVVPDCDDIACVVAAALNFVIEKVAYRPLRNSAQAGAADHRHRRVHPAADAGHDHLEAEPKPYPTLLPSAPSASVAR